MLMMLYSTFKLCSASQRHRFLSANLDIHKMFCLHDYFISFRVVN